MTGHLKEKCYCIHGYPSWHKLFGKPKPKPKLLAVKNSVVANVTQVPTHDTWIYTSGKSVSVGLQTSQGSSVAGMHLTDSQCQQLIQVLQKSMSSTSTATTPAPGNSEIWSTFHCTNTVQVSDKRHFVSQVHSISNALPQCKWIIALGLQITLLHTFSCFQMYILLMSCYSYQMVKLLKFLMLELWY